MGGGFGGCTISLVKCGKETELQELFKTSYLEKYGKDPVVLIVNISDGTSEF